MPESWLGFWARPLWLGALALVPVIWWLHRFAGGGVRVAVASLSLWRDAATSAGTQARKATRADPAWRRRAAIAALLVLAIAGPQWPLVPPPLTVWVDTSSSLFSIEADGSSRLERLLAEAEALHTGARIVEYRSLAAPGAAVNIGDITPASALLSPPAPAAMRSDREHWLLSDGASEEVRRWAESAPLSRVLSVGSATENSAITGFSVRAAVNSDAPEGTARLAASVTVQNGGLAADSRVLRLTAGKEELVSQRLELPAGSTVTRHFTITAGNADVTASLNAGDPLTIDDFATLSATALAPPTIAIRGACPPAVTNTLAAHPGVALVAGGSATLQVVCGAQRPAAGPPALWFYAGEQPSSPAEAPRWANASDALASVPVESLALHAYAHDVPLHPLLMDGNAAIAGFTRDADRHLLVSVDTDVDALNRSPWWPVWLAALLDHLAGAELLTRGASAPAPPSAIIAPQPLHAESVASAPLAATISLSRWLLVLAIVLLVIDWLLATRPRPWHASGRLVVAGLLAVAAIAPPMLAPPAANDFLVVLDASHSRTAEGRARGWQAVVARLREVPPGSKVLIVRFGVNVIEEQAWLPLSDAAASTLLDAALPPATRPVDASASNLQAGLRYALQRVRHGKPTTVLIDSDGAWTHEHPGAVLNAIRRAGIGVQWTTEPVVAKRLVIYDLQVPQHAARDVALRVTASVGKLQGAARARWLVDGKLADEQPLPASEGPARLTRRLGPLAAGARTVTLQLMQAAQHVQRQAVVNVSGAAPLLYVGKEERLPSLLAATGRQVAVAETSTLTAALENDLQATVILDDVPGWQLTEATMTALVDHVTRRGAGLVLLAGPRTLAVDSESPLAALSPVSLSQNTQQPPVAVQFVLDTSGSMAQGPSGASRLALARRALLQSVAQLSAQDSFGLITFAAEPREWLPLARHAQPLQALNRIALDGPGGGSVLLPALELASKRLAQSPTQHRILALVTDGFVEATTLDQLYGFIDEAGIDVLALAVGDRPRLDALDRLAAINDGRLLAVNAIAELPRLLPDAIAHQTRRPVTGPVMPVVRTLQAREAGSWPALDAYAPAELKTGAVSLLEAPRGEPLVAYRNAGAGKVLAFTGGLGTWAPGWLAWPALPAGLDALLRQIDSAAGSSDFHTRVTTAPFGTRVAIEALTADGNWRALDATAGLLYSPDGGQQPFTLTEALPGRYHAYLPVRAPGRYGVQLTVDGRPVRHDFFHDRAIDPLATDQTARAVAELAAAGLTNTQPTVPGAAAFPEWLVRLLALVSLALYLSLLLVCYGPAAAGPLFLPSRNLSHATGLQH